MIRLDILPLASSFFCAGTSFLVFIRSRFNLPALAFCLGMLSLSLAEFASFMALRAATGEKILLWQRISLTGEILLAGNWLFFSFTFGKVNFKSILKKWKWILPLIYLFPIIFVVSFFTIPQTLNLANKQLILLGTLGKYFHILLLSIIIMSLVNFENTFRSSAGMERWRIKYFLFGIGAILIFYVYIVSERLLYHVININNIYIMSSVIIVANILVIYSIIITKVVDRDIYISRRVIYTSISLIAIGLYSIIISLIAKVLKALDVNNYFKIDIFFIFFAILFMVIVFYKESLRRKIKAVINRNFKKSKYVYRDEWLVFSKELSKSVRYKELSERFLKTLSERIFVDRLSLWLIDENESYFHLVCSQGLEISQTKMKNDVITTTFLFEQNRPLKKHDLVGNEKVQISQDMWTLLKDTKTELLVPLELGNRRVGFLTLGQIQTGEAYDEKEDYNLLKSVAAHAASAIHNARLFDEQIRMKELETFNRLSAFIMHDLKNATSMLSLVVQNAQQHLCDPEFQKDSLETISSAIAKMKNMIGSLSAFRTEPVLQRQELDLNKVINEAVDKLALSSLPRVSLKRQLGRIPIISADAEEMHKVVHNLLLNAHEALNGGGLIRISTAANGAHVVISVSDNGPGMTKEFIENALFQPFKSSKKNGLGIGMYQCKTIVEAHGGKIEVESKPGKGSNFLVYLPG